MAVGATMPLPDTLSASPPLPALPPVPAAVPELSVVIVNYCQWDNTIALTRRLARQAAVRRGAAEIVIVDNHSPAHPRVGRLRRWPGVSLRRWGRNRGFARAVNEGVRLSRGRWLLLLNPDVSVPDGFLADVQDLAERLAAEDPRAGIVGFQLRNPDGSRQGSSGPFPTLAGTLLRLARPRSRRKYDQPSRRRRCRVPWVTGCCQLVRRECLAEVGGLDERFFLYYEDVDLCRRAAERGWSVWYEPAVRVVHHRPLHGRAVPAHVRVTTRHSLLTYAARYWPRWQLHVLGALVRIEAWARQKRADWRRDTQVARWFARLRALTRAVVRGKARTARRRLEQMLQAKDVNGEANHGPFRRDPQRQPAGPSARLPGLGRSPCTAADRSHRGG